MTRVVLSTLSDSMLLYRMPSPSGVSEEAAERSRSMSQPWR